MFNERPKSISDRILNKILPNYYINPFFFTIPSVIFKILMVISVFSNKLPLAGFFCVLEGFFDILDGFYARKYKKISSLGGFIDHAADHLIRPFAFLGLIYLQIVSPLLGSFAILTYLSVWIIASLRQSYNLKGKMFASSYFIFVAVGLIINQIFLATLLSILLSTITIIIILIETLIKNSKS